MKQKAKFFLLFDITSYELVEMFPMIFISACNGEFEGLQDDFDLPGVVPPFEIGFDVSTCDALVFQFYLWWALGLGQSLKHITVYVLNCLLLLVDWYVSVLTVVDLVECVDFLSFRHLYVEMLFLVQWIWTRVMWRFKRVYPMHWEHILLK